MPLDINSIISFLLFTTAAIESWSLKEIIALKLFKQNTKNRISTLENEVFENENS